MQRSSAELPTFDSQLSTTGQGVACLTTQSQVTRTVMGNCSTRRVRTASAKSSAQGPGPHASTSTAKVSAAQAGCLQRQRCHPLALSVHKISSARQAAPPCTASSTATRLAVRPSLCQGHEESLPCCICRLPAHLFEHQVGSLGVHMEVELCCGGDVTLVLRSAHDIQPLHCSTGEAAVPSVTTAQVPQSAGLDPLCLDPRQGSTQEGATVSTEAGQHCTSG